MALKIRCQQCSKKISIDEAFAGGVCRCPYCSAITMVPGDITQATGGERPDRPLAPGMTQPERPPAPTAAPSPAPAAPAGHREMPTARPIFVQGVVTMVMISLLVLMVVISIAWSIYYFRTPTGPGGGGGGAGPTTTGSTGGGESFGERKSALAGMKVQSPVVYVLDAGSGMRDFLDPANMLIQHSVRSLGDAGRFNLLVPTETGLKSLSTGWVAGGEGGVRQVREFLTMQAAGVTDLQAATVQGLGQLPKTLVLLAAKRVEDAPAVLEKAKAAGAAITSVGFGGASELAMEQQRLAEQTGGRSRQLRSISAVMAVLSEFEQ